jgi:hypothetical protein
MDSVTGLVDRVDDNLREQPLLVQFLLSRRAELRRERRSVMRIVVINHITLDGVMQAPGRPDEDTRGGFSHGGWAIPGNDEAMVQAIGERMAKPGSGMLLGRRSYEDMLASWYGQGGPYTNLLTAARLDWPTTTTTRARRSTASPDREPPDCRLGRLGCVPPRPLSRRDRRS